ncbi:MAG TPA: nitroreductase/quinone reductase family protein [Acidimicrobiales bacterium]|nr:nitroreductase/quinone reductase family protein [Acidimicrobiales bacterium]
MPSDLSFKLLNSFHRLVLSASRGRLGSSGYGMPVLQLTTTGRRSGQQRTSMLTSPYQEGSTIVIVASRGGDDHHPAWFLNLRDNPEVTVSIGGKPPMPMRAEVAGSDERARLWPLVIADHRNYAGYQRKTSREIPLVLLRPIAG